MPPRPFSRPLHGHAAGTGPPRATGTGSTTDTGSNTVTAALVVTFLGLALFAVLTAVETRTVTQGTTRSVRQSDLYQKARYWVGAEESLERKYRLEPSPAIEALHTRAASNFLMVMRAARNNSDPAEQRRLSVVLDLHTQYVRAVRLGLFPAVRTHDTAHVNNIDRIMVDPIFDQMQASVEAEARAHRKMSSAQLARLIRLQDTLALLTPLVFLAGLGIMVFLWRVMQRNQQRLDAANEATMTRLRAEAITDPLTSLGNHRAFQEGLGAAIRLGALDGTPLTLVRLNLDEFKVINDRAGHLHGDSVLSSVGHLLGMTFPGRSYRVGGDEFALLLPVAQGHAASAIHDLRAALVAAQLPTISAGLTTTVSATISPDDLHQQAHEALREAKRRGRNRVTSFQDVAGRASLLGQEQVEALRELLHAGQMEVAFQPIWGPSMPGRARAVPLAFEALARPAATTGFRNPQHLFDVADRVGRSAELDRLCIRAALGHAPNLPDGALLFLNLSPQTLDQDTTLAAALLADVQGAGLPAHRVVIEITERSTGNLPAVMQQAGALRAAGFRLALDDVGAGNAGLEMLRCMPVDFVKIDRSVVAAAPTDSTANAVLAAMMAYAREAGVTVIVEGIETPEILGHAWNLGARCAQGYLLGRPAAGFTTSVPDDLERLLTHTSTETAAAAQHVPQS